MSLSKNILADVAEKENLCKPTEATLNLPEKVLQFGTGVLLRGLPDYYIDKANKKGIFNGSIVIVKSTAQNKASDFDQQDNLYTVCVRGIENGQKVNEHIINSSISRVLSAKEDWAEVVKCASNKEMQVVISNTTEVGISLDENDNLLAEVAPNSFPGKLTKFLFHRFQHFNGAADAGMVILPTELITDNGSKLKAICLELASINKMDAAFITWLEEANDFCDTLVDRIVPGALRPHDIKQTEEYLGYNDQLMIMSEVYSLWAIETKSERTKEILSFAAADKGIVVTENIEKFRNLKLRLLNGAHTFSCGLALLSGFETVKEAMDNAYFERFINDLMVSEITKTLVSESIREEEAVQFSKSVLDRFRNPYIEHRWESISKQYTAKMMMRNVPTLLAFYERFNKVPRHMALGFAAYLYFMRTEKTATGGYFRHSYGKQIAVEDNQAEVLNDHWNKISFEESIHEILADTNLWNADLTKLPGFEEAVMNNIRKLRTQTKLTHNTVIA